MRLGLGLGGSLDDVAADARTAEAAGFDAAWVAELDRSAIVQAAAAIAATKRLAIGTAVALAFPRAPTILAMEAWDLAELSRGRFRLGLGTQIRRVLEARFGTAIDRPAARLADYAAAVRAVWAANRGGGGAHDGPFYRIAMPTFHGQARPNQPAVPILFAAVGPLMSRTAGALADGLIGHPLASPRYLAEIVAPAVARGLAAAGRRADACPIIASPLVALDDDVDAARRAAKLQLAFYATTPAYRPILALHGRADLGRPLRRAFATGDTAAMIAAIDDELLDAIAIAGRPDEAIDRLAAWEGVAGEVILAPPWYRVAPEAGRQYSAAIVGAFRRALDTRS